MVNLKNITDVPMAESAEGLNLIVNDNGAAKQIAASAVGAQADWNETDETSPAFIMNKPEALSGGAVTYTMTNGYIYYGKYADGNQVSYNDFMSDFSNGIIRYSENALTCGTIVGYTINSANSASPLSVYVVGTFGGVNQLGAKYTTE